jgi:CRISPR/Cas system CMR-associated protein Cmr5 small subunit
VTKNKVGYRLREILSGKTRTIRQKSSEGPDQIVKAYDFELDKLRKIAKKYGYELVTKLLTLLSSEGVKASDSPLFYLSKHGEVHETEEKTVEKTANAQGELSYISNIVTKTFESQEDQEDNKGQYTQLACFFCGKGIMDNEWTQNNFSENKPAHKKCYKEKCSQLKQPVEMPDMPDFEDKCQPPDEES